MNRDGQYTDRRGRVLAPGARVRVVKDEGPVFGSGTVQSLPKEGNDWHGFPLVEFDHDHKRRHVPDTGFDLIDTDDTAGRVQAVIDATKERNAAMRRLIGE